VELTLDDLFRASFKPGGRDPGGALDCQGLFLEVMRRYGHDVKDTDTASYATEIVTGLIEGEIKTGKWQRLDAPVEGCAVVLAIDPGRPREAQHLGVCLGGGRFIHILKSRGVIVSRCDDRFFKGKIRGYYRWIG
jgi:cell wall-associated NlpC family hydrolase